MRLPPQAAPVQRGTWPVEARRRCECVDTETRGRGDAESECAAHWKLMRALLPVSLREVCRAGREAPLKRSVNEMRCGDSGSPFLPVRF
jgi:hypothetical protein